MSMHDLAGDAGKEEMPPGEDNLSEVIRRLYEIVGDLEKHYERHHRHFTLDGHLLGSIGEVYAAERYGIELFRSSKETHDGVTRDGTEKSVQIKVTQRKSIGLSSKPEYLIVLHVDGEGRFEEVYNGPGEEVWGLVCDKPVPKNGQYQISLGKLAALDESVPEEERVQPSPNDLAALQ